MKLIANLFKLAFAGLILLISLMVVRTILFLQQSNNKINNNNLQPKEIKQIIPWTQTDKELAIQRLSKGLTFKTLQYPDPSFDDLFTQLFKDFNLLFNNNTSSILQEITNDIKSSVSEEGFLAAKVFLWKGLNNNLKPILLTGHVDVVPINDEKQWIYPPFSGAIKDGYIYGRGALDDKFAVYGMFEAIQQLIKNKLLIQPERDIYISIGMDEEIGGYNGARKVTDYFLKKGIEFAFILDEGGLIGDKQVPIVDKPIALVSIAEKGHCDLQVKVNCDPGHSSMPSPNTCINMLAKAIVDIEKNPMPSYIANSFIQILLKDLLPYTDSFISKLLVVNLDILSPIVDFVITRLGGTLNAMIRTTITPTIINAGDRPNVLPSFATLNLNTRILPYDSVESIENHLKKVINNPNITFTTGGAGGQSGRCAIQKTVACSDCVEFEIIRKSINEVQPDVIVAPYLFIAGSDSFHYRDLSKFSYGYVPMRLFKEHNDLGRIHGHNERASVENYIEAVDVYGNVILNLNEMLKKQ
ncbi:hypothetical protein ABK040_006710 [Willaertia magna]